MTRIAAAEAGKLGYGVRVNCVYPGLVPTTQMGLGLAEQAVALGLFPSIEACAETVVGMTPAGRLGEIPEIADAVVFLASDAARYVTGTGLAVDGGLGS
jgi:NAD(P)-dependent dehydrogenase (short-subunit alcohol dehydrogenase family)